MSKRKIVSILPTLGDVLDAFGLISDTITFIPRLFMENPFVLTETSKPKEESGKAYYNMLLNSIECNVCREIADNVCSGLNDWDKAKCLKAINTLTSTTEENSVKEAFKRIKELGLDKKLAEEVKKRGKY